MAEKPNEYKAYLTGRRAAFAAIAEEVRQTLDKAVVAHRDGAWVSSAGNAFGAELSGRSGSLHTVGDRIVGELTDAIAGEPDTVDENDWRARWSQTSRFGRMLAQ